MNFFRRKKNPEKLKKPQDEHLINELCNVLKSHGDAILHGKTKFTLTTPILVTLNGYFQKITEGVNEACFQVANQGGETSRLQSVLFIFDFIQKVLCLKLTSGTIATVCPLLTVEYFKALQVLEIRRINILSVKGLHLIRRQIKSLKCFHAAFSIDDVVLAFGRNCEDRQTLPMLETLDISYNQVKSLNDDALKLIPALTYLDASYNSIISADSEALPPISWINLGYNMIYRIPSFSNSTYNSLTTMNLRNNNLSSLEGLEYFSALVSLDVTANCIVDFKDFSQLAALENLCMVRMQENPVSYNPGYRLCIIRSLSPVKRTAKVSIDGITLNSSEQCHLGANVQPVALTSYLIDRPLSVSSGDCKDLNDVPIAPSPSFKSTPRERRKVRNAVIGEAKSTENSPFPILIRSSGSSLKDSNISPALLSKTDSLQSLTSEVNSLGQRTDYDSWAVEEELRSELNSNASIEEITGTANSLSPRNSNEETYSASVYGATTAMTLSTVVNEINESKGIVRSIRSDEYSNRESDDDGDDDDGISVVSTDGEMEYAYLVETVPKKTKDEDFGSEDAENIFIIFKPPYLVEKSDDGTIKCKLDLNYLNGFEMSAKAEDMTITLHFDLIREDSKYRQYRFPEEEQYDSFVAAIQPISVKNHQKKLAEMKYCECLKCGIVFLNRQMSEEYYECPDCGSRMVIEKSSTKPSYRDNNNDENECDECDGDLPSNVSSSTIRTNRDDSSIAIVIPSSKDSTRIDACFSSWPTYCAQNLSLNHGSKSLPFSQASQIKVEETTNLKPAPFHDISSIYKKHSTCSKSYSDSPGSCTSSVTSKSCSHSRQASKGSIKKLPRSAMHTPVISNQESLFSNMEDFGKCNHRLKLYLDINFFSKLNEEFLCQIRSDCTGYDKMTVYDSILVVTNKTVYIFVIVEPDSDSPENCVKKLAFCPVPQLRYFQCGFSYQSFLVDTIKPGFRYKFMVGDSKKCNNFLSYIEDIIHSHLAYTDVIPSVLREVNPQTLSNVRQHIFNVAENAETKGQRIYKQITKYSHPPLLKTKKMRIRTHHQCFLAKEFIDWLCAHKEVTSRQDAVNFGQELLDGGTIYNTSKDHTFRDDDGVYKFLINGATANGNSSSDTVSIDTMNSDDGEMDLKVLVYQIVKSRILEQETVSHPSTIVLTNSHIFLVTENHQWPLSRLLPPPGQLESQYHGKDMNKITNITTMEFYEDAPCFVRICLVKEEVDEDEISWLIETASIEEMKKLTKTISKIWKDLFVIELTTLMQPTILPILDSYILV